ncbi:MAG: hypothetical protein D6734_00455 [Candidatus Schekmanbacteria bacterium]|nr:MAG: hypothetical protein D6734_00455 [Candidatus Schekmanbacteria bacterium]
MEFEICPEDPSILRACLPLFLKKHELKEFEDRIRVGDKGGIAFLLLGDVAPDIARINGYPNIYFVSDFISNTISYINESQKIADRYNFKLVECSNKGIRAIRHTAPDTENSNLDSLGIGIQEVCSEERLKDFFRMLSEERDFFKVQYEKIRKLSSLEIFS